MAVFHTAGEPPSSGSTIFANISSRQKIRTALTMSVRANSGITEPIRRNLKAGDAVF